MLHVRHLSALLTLLILGAAGCQMDGQFRYWYGAPHNAMTEAAWQLHQSRTNDPVLVLRVSPGNIGRAPGPGESMTVVAWQDGSILTVDDGQPVVCARSREDIARVVTGVSEAGIFGLPEEQLLVPFPVCGGSVRLECNRDGKTAVWTASDEVLKPDWATHARSTRDARVDWLLQAHALRCVE